MSTEYMPPDAPRPALSRRQALSVVGKGAVLGVVAASAVVAISPTPTEAVAGADPLLALIEGYESAREDWLALAFVSDAASDAAYDKMLVPFLDRFENDPPAPTSDAGALAALRLVHEHLGHSHGSFERPMIGAAMAFFAGRAH